MSMPERDTMHLRNKQVVGVLSFLLLATTSFWGLQAQRNQVPGRQNKHIQPTPPPPDVAPNDPALPVWAKPATPAPTPGNAAKPATPGNVPVTQPGKQP